MVQTSRSRFVRILYLYFSRSSETLIQIRKSVVAVHLALSIICLSVGFFCFIRFGLYDQCDLERTSSGWSVHRDLSDLSGGFIILGFIFLGVSIGVIGLG